MAKDTGILRVKEELERNPKGMTIEDISRNLSLNRGTAAKYLNLLVISGQADMRTFGPAKLFSISRRVPLSRMLSVWTDPILILDSGFLIHEVNDSLLQYFHIKSKQVMGMQIMHSPLAPYFTEEHLQSLKAALSGEEKIFEEEIHIQGKAHIFRIRVLPIVFDQGGKGIGCILTDITGIKAYQQDLEIKVQERTELLRETNVELERQVRELKRIELDISRTEMQYHTLLNNIQEVIFTLDDQGSITYISPAIHPLLGITAEEMLGRQLQDHVLSEDLIPFTRGLDNSWNGNPAPFEFRLVTHDGGLLWVQVTGKPVEPDGFPPGYQGIMIDIQEKKRTEDTLRQANKQLVLLNSITRHDILNGVTKLNAYFDISKRQIKEPRLLEILEKERAVTSTIQRQISFTREYQNIGIRPPQWKNLEAGIRAAAAGLDLGSIRFEVKTKNTELFADELLAQVFTHLIENSVKHGGSVTKISFSFTAQGRSAVLVCEDNGKGIPADQKELIFEHSHGGKATYGLFFSREVLAITGITLRETGEPGKGARFEMTVPKGTWRTTGNDK